MYIKVFGLSASEGKRISGKIRSDLNEAGITDDEFVITVIPSFQINPKTQFYLEISGDSGEDSNIQSAINTMPGFKILHCQSWHA